MPDEQPTFRPRDTLKNTLEAGGIFGVAGLIVAGTRNTLARQNVGAMGIFSQSGHIIAVFTASGAAYQFTKDVSSNVRGKDDSWSEAMGGFATGLCMGIAKRSLAFMIGYGVSGATLMALVRYTGGLRGDQEIDPDDFDAADRREEEKLRRRRPILETIEELGEGRGIYAPGYAERRRQRLMDKYGVDVKAAEENR